VELNAAVARLQQSPGFLLSRVGTAVQANFKQTLARWQLKPLHFLLLVVLDGTDGTSQQELCRTLKIDSGNMVELLDHLETLELARRSPDPSDRRRHIVTITDAGHDTLTEGRAAVEALDQEFLSPLTDSERDRLVTALAKLYAATAEGRRATGPVGLEPKGPIT
jgi:DNA-binding MarR family transcriptional regulator